MTLLEQVIELCAELQINTQPVEVFDSPRYVEFRIENGNEVYRHLFTHVVHSVHGDLGYRHEIDRIAYNDTEHRFLSCGLYATARDAWMASCAKMQLLLPTVGPSSSPCSQPR